MTGRRMPVPAADTQFTGQWVGETQGCVMPAHLWEIAQHLWGLFIVTRWEGKPQTGTFYAQVVPGEDAFRLHDFKAILMDAQHFVIRGWDTNDVRGDEGPHYDVVFSRPGLAELSARDVWLRFCEQYPAGSAE